MRAFALTSGVLLAFSGIIGSLQGLIVLGVLGRNSPVVLWWETFVSLVFMIGGITTCTMSNRLDPARHWVESLVSVVFAIIVFAILFGILRIAIPMKLAW